MPLKKETQPLGYRLTGLFVQISLENWDKQGHYDK